MKQQPLVVVHRKAFLAIVDHLWDLLGFAVNDILIFADRDSSDAEYRVTFVPVAQSPVQKHWPNGYSTVLSASVLEDPTSSGMKVFLSELTESLKKAFSDGEEDHSFADARQ